MRSTSRPFPTRRSLADKVDSATLAQLLRSGMIPEAHQIDRDLRDQRDTLRTRLTLVERRSSARQSIKTLLQKLNVRAVEELPALYQAQARCHQQQADLLAEQVKDLERELHPHLVPDEQVQRLLWIPGVGKTVVFTIRLEIGDVGRFPTAGQFFSYCRLVPGASDSASKRSHSHRKDGNRYLKLTFSRASVRAVQYYPVIRSFYERKLSRKPEAIARAIVKEIARIVYHVLRKREDFNGRFKGTPMSRQKKPNWPRLPRRAASPTVQAETGHSASVSSPGNGKPPGRRHGHQKERPSNLLTSLRANRGSIWDDPAQKAGRLLRLTVSPGVDPVERFGPF